MFNFTVMIDRCSFYMSHVKHNSSASCARVCSHHLIILREQRHSCSGPDVRGARREGRSISRVLCVPASVKRARRGAARRGRCSRSRGRVGRESVIQTCFSLRHRSHRRIPARSLHRSAANKDDCLALCVSSPAAHLSFEGARYRQW